jgi:flagellar hook-basal body complex protein FliE
MDVTRIAGQIANSVGALGGTAAKTGVASVADDGRPGSFAHTLRDSLAQVNSLQHEADRAIESLATGGPATLHDTMLAVEKAELSFKLMMQVRNKIVEAYQEILRMQV